MAERNRRVQELEAQKARAEAAVQSLEGNALEALEALEAVQTIEAVETLEANEQAHEAQPGVLAFFPKDEISGYSKQDVWARGEGDVTGIFGPKRTLSYSS